MNKIDTFEDLSFQDTNGNSALHWASSNGLLNTIPYLVEKMDNINIQNANGDTPLILAVKSNQIETAKCLIEMKSDVSIQNYRYIGLVTPRKYFDYTALHLAARDGIVELIPFLAEKMADKNILGKV